MIAIQDVLGRLDAVKRTGPSEWQARCPAHDDRTPSLSISDGRKGVVLHCHAGCDQKAVVGALGVDFKDLFRDPPSGNGNRPEIVATYDYTDADGDALFQVVRLFPKDFRQRHRCAQGRDGFTWGLGGNPQRCGCPRVSPVPFRLPRIIEGVALGKTVHVVEGEKDVLAMEKAGGVATTNAGGAGKWRDQYSATLRGARVVIVSDDDEPGMEHAEQVASSLEGVAASVEIVLPKEGKDAADHLEAGHTLDDFVPLAGEEEEPDRKVPEPIGMAELLAMEEPEERYHVEELVEQDTNVLLAAAPKSHKTNLMLHMAVTGCAARSVLGAFPVPEALRFGLVLMEDRPHRIRRRIERLAKSEGIDPHALDGRLFTWYRPPLRLTDPDAIRDLGDYVERYDLDVLAVDSYSYVSVGDSNSADEVTPQLMALSGLRDRRPGLCVVLIVHAGKHQENRGDRVTDIIRGSGAFGAWFDTGILLTRKDEHAPVTIRVEHRDLPAPDPFAFTVEDEFPGVPPSGFLRLRRSEKSADQLLREKNGEKLAPELKERLADHPAGVSRRELRALLDAPRRDVEAAFDVLQSRGEAEYTPSPGPGRAARYSLTVPGVP